MLCKTQLAYHKSLQSHRLVYGYASGGYVIHWFLIDSKTNVSNYTDHNT